MLKKLLCFFVGHIYVRCPISRSGARWNAICPRCGSSVMGGHFLFYEKSSFFDDLEKEAHQLREQDRCKKIAESHDCSEYSDCQCCCNCGKNIGEKIQERVS